MEYYYAVIPAAGIGKRMNAGKNKLLIGLNNEPVIIHTIRVFERDSWCKGIILSVNQNDFKEMNQLITKHEIKKVTNVVIGGKERQHSVYEGLKRVPENTIVLIHDGARPFVKEKQIHQLAEAAAKNGAAILAVPVKDTVKIAKDGAVQKTIDRSCLWAVQTPQAFRISVIKRAHEEAIKDSFIGTDDASLLERIGERVMIIEGDYDNIKITTPEDLYFANAILTK